VAASLRNFVPGDRPAVLELSRRALSRPQEQVGNPVWETREEMESELGGWDRPPEETLLVAEADGEIAGFGGLEVAPGWEHADLFGPLVGLTHRGQKIGGRLLGAAIEIGKESGASRIIGSIGTRNAAGRMMLERAGFRTQEGAHALYRLLPSQHRAVEEPPAGVEVQRGSPDDFDDALTLYHECFPTGRFPDEVWRRALERGTVYLAREGPRAVAVVDIDASDRWIYHLGVTSDEREHGVGAYVLSSALEDYWRDNPGQSLGLSVSADNVPAIRLYRRQGFAPWLVLQYLELAL
jgi:ribosomal protein S18 acetylase RimI-like enzyme